MTESKHEWLTQTQAADYLGVSRWTVQRYQTIGHFKRYGGRNSPRYRKDELEAYLRQHEPWKLSAIEDGDEDTGFARSQPH